MIRLLDTRLLILAAVLLSACPALAQTPREKLQAHSDEFRREIIQVTEGVHVAVGFGLANAILIEGGDGTIIVDTMESRAAAEAVKAEFDKITSAPVKAIIYTHSHYDHINGAGIFAGDANPEVIAHALLPVVVDDLASTSQPAIFARSNRQFGIPLPPDRFINDGIGMRLVLGGTPGGTAYLPPTKTFDGTSTEMTVAGVQMKLALAVGETDDQIYVWLPDKKVLMPGDNFYKAFPNLYAIRGTSYRDVRKWIASLDAMIAEGPEFLVPSHGRPLSGADVIRERLTTYRDAIQHVWDETIAGMNRGQTPDQLAHSIQLPEALANHPYLQEFYGTVPWSVRSIFVGQLGWFDGNATNLFPLPSEEKAKRMATLAGGEDKLLENAQAALAASDHQWAAELADHLLALDANNATAKKLKADALIALADQQLSANARNYYLTSAMQLGGF